LRKTARPDLSILEGHSRQSAFCQGRARGDVHLQHHCQHDNHPTLLQKVAERTTSWQLLESERERNNVHCRARECIHANSQHWVFDKRHAIASVHDLI